MKSKEASLSFRGSLFVFLRLTHLLRWWIAVAVFIIYAEA
jgi:hypothetical protein